MTSDFLHHLTPSEWELLTSLDTPNKIQVFLDSFPYSAENTNRCPVGVLRDRQAHCLDGGLFAAAALRQLGFPPLILDMFPEPGTDDDHILAIFRIEGAYGAIAKSNFSGLRWREPVYLSLRELVMSYFEVFFNNQAERTLRYYTRPLNLARFDHLGWMWRDQAFARIEQHLLRKPLIPVITPSMAARLSPVDQRSYQSGMLGVDPAGLYKI